MIIILTYIYPNFKLKMNLQKLNFPDIQGRLKKSQMGKCKYLMAFEKSLLI